VSGTLFVVGTPIGNLGDLTDRARATLASVELVAAEDTRRTGLLLKAIGVSVRMVSLYDANEAARAAEVIAELERGHDVAIVSDGGMPLVSDPGYRVVRAAAERGVDVRVVPGPSAAIAALVVSGLPTDRWAFEGFLPRKGPARRARLAALAAEPRTLLFFESPRRTAATLADLAATFGSGREAALCRELTKLHEETVRGTLGELAAAFAETGPRGEVVLVVGGAPEAAAGPGDLEGAVAHARALMAGGARPREAARDAAASRGLRPNDVYAALTAEPS
jgi:16S rRNA (cytidine1402-2'-O)-methyltransferase